MGKLTHDDITQIKGMEDRLLGFLQKKYGYTKETAKKEYEEFMSRYKKRNPKRGIRSSG